MKVIRSVPEHKPQFNDLATPFAYSLPFAHKRHRQTHFYRENLGKAILGDFANFQILLGDNLENLPSSLALSACHLPGLVDPFYF